MTITITDSGTIDVTNFVRLPTIETQTNELTPHFYNYLSNILSFKQFCVNCSCIVSSNSSVAYNNYRYHGFYMQLYISRHASPSVYKV